MASVSKKENRLIAPTTELASASKNKTYQQDGYFHFPFSPYDIQVKFMCHLYTVLENGGVGIFESPTGTVSLY